MATRGVVFMIDRSVDGGIEFEIPKLGAWNELLAFFDRLVASQAVLYCSSPTPCPW